MVKLIGSPPNGEKRTVESYEFSTSVDSKSTGTTKN